jgi:hypothetical protein
MRPVEPTALHDGATLVVFAENQPQYVSLPASVDECVCGCTTQESSTAIQ